MKADKITIDTETFNLMNRKEKREYLKECKKEAKIVEFSNEEEIDLGEVADNIFNKESDK